MNGILLPAQAAGASPAPSAAAADVVVEGEAFAAVIARHAQALRVDAAHVADTQFPSEHTASDDENDGQQRAAVAADANAALASAMLHDLSAAAQLVTATACQSAVPLQPDNDAQPPAGKTAISAPPRSPARGLPLVAACGEDRRAAPPPADAIALAAIPPRPSAAEPAQLPDRPAAASGPQRSGAPSEAAAAVKSAAPVQLSALPLAGPAPATPPSPAFSFAHATLPAAVGSATFGEALAQRVVLFAARKVQQAELSVSPPDLGPIAVQIEVRGQEATLAFSATSQITRQAIEEALPRLREMFAAQGLQLAGCEVNDHPRREAARSGTPAGSRARSERVAPGTFAIEAAAPLSRRPLGLIDIIV